MYAGDAVLSAPYHTVHCHVRMLIATEGMHLQPLTRH
jgi:hypothetical protein